MIETVLDDHAIIGEAPLWDAGEGVLYWADIKAPVLHRYHPASGGRRRWTLTSDIGGFALLEDGGVLVALRYGLHRLDLDSGALTMLVPAPYDPALFRFNEAACDAAGRFWVGVMFDPLEGSPPPQRGQLHSFTLADGLRAEDDWAQLHNGMAWSADGGTFFLAHSDANEIVAFDYAVAGGILSKRRVFATIPSALGIPDGAAIDADGGYWSALHGGGKLRRFRADGSVDRDIDLPISQPTMCAFAGDDLATLYVTSASDKLSQADKAREPLAGASVPPEAGRKRSAPPNELPIMQSVSTHFASRRDKASERRKPQNK